MSRTLWQPTVFHDHESCAEDASGSGCLLQIHPLQIDNGLMPLETDAFTIGRDEACDLCVRDASISRCHAIIEKRESGYVISDRGSTNGTWINEQPVQQQVLVPGDRVRLGSVIFKFLSTTHIETQYHEAVYSMMTRDSLTGVWNKRYFMEVLEREIKRNTRHQRPTFLILFDIDHFKSINDTYGHLAGDEVLRELAQRVDNVLRDDEVLARYGGEEFAVVLGETEAAEATAIAERCREVVAGSPFSTSEGFLEVTISIGVADSISTNVTTPAGLIEQADMRLYAAKRGGRNRVCT